MNAQNSTIFGVVRTLVAAAGGYLIGKGWADAATVEAIAGAVATIAAAVWSVFAKKPTSTPPTQ